MAPEVLYHVRGKKSRGGGKLPAAGTLREKRRGRSDRMTAPDPAFRGFPFGSVPELNGRNTRCGHHGICYYRRRGERRKVPFPVSESADFLSLEHLHRSYSGSSGRFRLNKSRQKSAKNPCFRAVFGQTAALRTENGTVSKRKSALFVLFRYINEFFIKTAWALLTGEGIRDTICVPKRNCYRHREAQP